MTRKQAGGVAESQEEQGCQWQVARLVSISSRKQLPRQSNLVPVGSPHATGSTVLYLQYCSNAVLGNLHVT